MNHQMEINGLSATFHMPPALKKKIINGKEVAQGLPPAKSVQPYKVDEYPAAPTSWKGGSAKAGSYFLAVKEGKGMWLDFNACCNHTHHVAVVISVQGVNPISGLKQNKFSLEQYGTKCPKHDVEFQQDRFCPKCKYKWPAQNYLASVATPQSLFWLDGFRGEDGKVAQYVLTPEEAKGVAAQTIGKERVFAIGIAFFLSKEPKPVYKPTSPLRGSYGGNTKGGWDAEGSYGGVIGSGGGAMMGGSIGSPGASMGDAYPPVITEKQWQSSHKSINHVSTPGSFSLRSSASVAKKSLYSADLNEGVATQDFGDVLESFSPQQEVVTEKQLSYAPPKEVKITSNLEVGHGAAIDQRVYDDPSDLSFYADEPAGLLYISYATAEEVAEILAGGKREELEGGFLAGVNSAAE